MTMDTNYLNANPWIEEETFNLQPNRKFTCHRDGTVSFWSVYRQQWVRTRYITDREFAAMNPEQRERARKHLNV